jgi:hypothetical protein
MPQAARVARKPVHQFSRIRSRRTTCLPSQKSLSVVGSIPNRASPSCEIGLTPDGQVGGGSTIEYRNDRISSQVFVMGSPSGYRQQLRIRFWMRAEQAKAHANRAENRVYFFLRFLAVGVFPIAKSSSFFPSLIAATSHRGLAPRPAQALPALSRYFAGTFLPFSEPPRPRLGAMSAPNLASWLRSSVLLRLSSFPTSSRNCKSCSTDIEPRFVFSHWLPPPTKEGTIQHFWSQGSWDMNPSPPLSKKLLKPPTIL